jgi:large subunit ribosomal protein L3
LIYVKGCIPGVDNAFIKVTDAIKKSWAGKAFPEGAIVPFPTSYQEGLDRELVESVSFDQSVDPFTMHE